MTLDALLAGYPVTVTQAVVWGEMDGYRHVNNVVYFRYFENVRVLYVARVGWDLKLSGFGPILQAVKARFRRPLHYPDTITIAARATAIGSDRLVLEHRIVSHEQQAVTTDGESVLVTYDFDINAKVMMPEDLRRRIVELEGREVPALTRAGRGEATS